MLPTTNSDGTSAKKYALNHIIKSTKVKELWLQGDHAGAQKAADDAKKYSIWGMVAGGVVVILYIIFVVVLGVAGGGF